MICYRNTEQERAADARLLLFFMQYDTIIKIMGFCRQVCITDRCPNKPAAMIQ